MAGETSCFWISLPPGAEQLDLLAAGRDHALPLIDLRSTEEVCAERTVDRARALGLHPLAVIATGAQLLSEAPAWKPFPPGTEVVVAWPTVTRPEAREVVSRLRTQGVVVGFEVDSAVEARTAVELGADFLFAAGVEGGGPVSSKSALVLLQELLPATDLPLVLSGGFGPLGAAGALVAGCASCVLDAQILLTPESPLPEARKRVLRHASVFDAILVGGMVGRPWRLLTHGQRRAVDDLLQRERELFLRHGASDEAFAAMAEAVAPHLADGGGEPGHLAPVGQGICFAQQFAAEELDLATVLQRYREALQETVARLTEGYPFRAGSDLARQHDSALPLVQGPMACVTDHPGLARAVSAEGGLPFVATTTLSPAESAELIRATRAALDGRPFGAGLVRLGDPERMDQQLTAVVEARPDYVTFAGGEPAHARRCEEAGVRAYLHAPSLPHLQAFLDEGVEGVIFEGHEAGGHVGALTSLVLWELGVGELLSRPPEQTARLRVLFAGGLATRQGALVAAALAAPLIDHGVAAGLQLGTAYLLTHEAVESGALPASYQEAAARSALTTTTGNTTNLPSRWLCTEGVEQLLSAELGLQLDGVSLAERKRRVERLGFAHTVAALQGRGAPLRPPVPTAVDGTDETALTAAYSCGQVVAAEARPGTVAALHAELTDEAATLARERLELVSLVAAADDLDGDLDDAVAIIGLGCLFPGADSPQEFWENILERRCFVHEVPKERWDPANYYDPRPATPDKSSSRLGAFLDHFEKNPIKFRIPPNTASSIDEAQFMALEVAHQALTDAGLLERGFPRERTSVYFGNSLSGGQLSIDYGMRVNWSNVWNQLQRTEVFVALPEATRQQLAERLEEQFKAGLAPITEDSCAGTLSSIVAGRICHCFDLGGEAYTIDGACASALSAVSNAVDALRSGSSDVALAGAVDTAVFPKAYVLFSKLEALSDTGSFPFDERADGFVMAEGAGCVVLKRYVDALRDGDPIYALVRGIGRASDGRGKGITAPDVVGQVRAMERAYEDRSFSPASLSLVEAHGTATPVGDLTEHESMRTLLERHGAAQRSIALGSVKSNIGHLKTAAGMAGLIKVALAMRERTLPPTINCETPRREIDWDRSPLYLNREARPWSARGEPRRAAVNAFGFGGVNYHVVLEEPPAARAASGEHSVTAPSVEPVELPAQVMILRARSRQALGARLVALQDALASGPSLDVLAAQYRDRLPSDGQGESGGPAGPTLSLVATDPDRLASLIDKAKRILDDSGRAQFHSAQGVYFCERPLNPAGKVAFLFPGQGAQYVNMGGDLATRFAEVRALFEKVDRAASGHTGQRVLEVLQDEATTPEELERRQALLVRTDFNHPTILAMSAAISMLLRRTGVVPDMVAGHSVGEYLALHEAGVFDLDGAVNALSVRGRRLYEDSYMSGTMASVRASVEQTEAVLGEISGLVYVANKNCPSQTVIGGEPDAVEAALQRFAALEIDCVPLRVSSAFHTPMLSSTVPGYRAFLEKVEVRPPRLPVQCNRTGRAYETEGDFAATLREALGQHFVHPVEFTSNVESLYADGARLFVEVGPGSTLCAFVDDILQDRPHWTVATNVARRPGTLQLLHAIAFCAAHGVDVDLEALAPVKIPEARRPPRVCARGPRSRTGRSERPSERTPSRSLAQSTIPERAPTPDLVTEALADRPRAEVAAYLRQRRGFIQEMVRLDFSHHASTSDEDGRSALARQVVRLVADKTGYPVEIIELDADVEAELGLDSIKQVEIVRQLQRDLGVRLGDGEEVRRYKITTLGALVEALVEAGGSAPSTTTETSTERSDSPRRPELEPPARSERETPRENLETHRFVPQLRAASLCPRESTGTLAGQRVAILDGGAALGPQVAALLEARAAVPRLISSEATVPDDIGDADLVVDLTAVGGALGALDAALLWRRAEARGAFLLEVVQRMVRSVDEGRGGPRRWVVVTELGGALGVGPAPVASDLRGQSPHGTALAGLGLGIARVATLEHADAVDTLFLDFDRLAPGGDRPERDSVGQSADPTADELEHAEEFGASQIVAELEAPSGHREIGYRGTERHEIHWVIDDDGPAEPVALDRESVVLAVGGARGITAAICQALAAEAPAHFAVVGRSAVEFDPSNSVAPPVRSFEQVREEVLESQRAAGGKVTPADVDRLTWEQVWADDRARGLAALVSLGARVEYHAVDIADPAATVALLRDVRRRLGGIDIVIQGGGALLERSLRDLSGAELARGARSKALGTASLIAALEERPPHFFVNLSSVVGRFGYLGLAPYAAGHEVAAHLVASQRGEGRGTWINLYYGPWLDVGMTRLGSTRERLQERGGAFIAPADGARFFMQALARGVDSEEALTGAEPFGLFAPAASSTATAVFTDPPAAVAAPLLDSAEVVEPGVAQGRRRFDATREPFVGDHCILDEPLLPGAIGLEMMAQTAALLRAEGSRLIRIEEAEFPRPIRFPRQKPREVHARVRLETGGGAEERFVAELYTLFCPPNGGPVDEVLHGQCRLVFGQRPAPTPPSLPVVCRGFGDSMFSIAMQRQAYNRERLGLYRNVPMTEAPGQDGLVSRVLAPVVSAFGPRPETGNPVRLDGLFFACDFLLVIATDNQIHYLESAKRIEFFGDDSPAAERVCRLRLETFDERGGEVTVEAVDTSGRVLERISGLRKAAAKPGDAKVLPEDIWRLLGVHPQVERCGELLGLQRPPAVTHMQMPMLANLLERGRVESFLEEQLTVEERATFDALQHPRRRVEWLAGRLVAKGAVRAWLVKEAPPPSEIFVARGEEGEPILRTPSVEGGPLNLSIAHSGDFAVAVATTETRVGIDVERFNFEIEEIAGEFCTEAEVALALAAVDQSKVLLLNEIWTTKEAVRKALGARRVAFEELRLCEVVEAGEFTVLSYALDAGGRARAAVVRNEMYLYACGVRE